MSSSFITKMCAKFRTGMVKICITIGAVLIVIPLAALMLPVALGLLMLAWAKRAANHNAEPATIYIVPANA